jgi:hypothetical protein
MLKSTTRNLFGIFLCFCAGVCSAKEINTNEINMINAPVWLKQSRVEKVTNRIQSKLEWSTRKINVSCYNSESAYEKVNSYGATAVAVTQMSHDVASIHLGPKVNEKNFDEIFGHELVHVIVFQKYRGAIPKWLEEGLANHLASYQKVDYKWLNTQAFPADVRELAHPFGGNAAGVSYRYKASQAFAEMLDKKCGLENLIRLSVGRKMEDYISTYCGIDDLNKAFKDWVKKKI